MRTRMPGPHRGHSPLRRRCDVVETWTVLAAALLILVGAPLAGAATGRWAYGEAKSMSVAQHAERHRVRAEVVGRSGGSLPSAQAGGQHAYRATVRWTEDGGGARTARVRVRAGTGPGEVVDVWLDSRGRTVGRPLDGTAVWQHALTMGVGAAGGAVLLVLLGHCAVRRVALRRRLAEWDRAWARTEPLWTHRNV
ncbi:Rv1733c family protein [Streptomyces djakartensis]|uniref:Rv1733c family protein n=1 Tax=Streptomyces djakartensis TaxID=68193 RepID=UPI0034DED0E9